MVAQPLGSGFLNGGDPQAVASSINDALLLLRTNHEWARAPGRFNYSQGLCWAPSMEEEANIQQNPNTIVRVKHPVLKQRMAMIYRQLTRVIPNMRKPDWDDIEKRFEGFKAQYPQLAPYTLKSEYAHFKRMSNEMQAEHNTNMRSNRLEFMLWLANRYAVAVTRIQDIPCTCKADHEIALLQVLPVGANTPDVICYNACDRTLFAAFKRQLMRVYEPDPDVLQQFTHFAQQYFNKYIRGHLLDFDYSYTQWYNKMPRNKQVAIDRARQSLEEKPPDFVEYGLFCKREKQEAGGKNRAIANIDPVVKYIMGPVTWALEDIADKHFPGYCGKKNWEQLEDKFEQYYKQGFIYVLQGDGSAFDACQDVGLKVIDRMIYNYLADRKLVHHVDNELFRRMSTARLRRLNATRFTKTGTSHMATATILGTVFSGASDTTLMNTIRMALYNMFTLHRCGLEYGTDYQLLCKGDDFMVFVKTRDLEGRAWEDIYMDVWCPKSKSMQTDYETGSKGKIGVILKFLNVGGYHTIDFCSTTCIPYDAYSKFKLARKPTRMDPLAHYSRNAIKFTALEFKQYLLDQATALEVSHGRMPYYRNYIDAYRFWAQTIPGQPKLRITGRQRRILPHDGHRTIEHTDDYDYRYANYGYDFIQGIRLRRSTHQPSDAEVYDHLLTHFGISQNSICAHRIFLTNPGIYDPQY